MDISVNLVAVLLATVSSMFVGWFWYSNAAFGKYWSKVVGLSAKQIERSAPKAMTVTVVANLITAYVLAYFAYIVNLFMANSFLQDALLTGFLAWLGFTAARMITHDAFEQRNQKLTAIHISHEFVTLFVMALIIGLLKP